MSHSFNTLLFYHTADRERYIEEKQETWWDDREPFLQTGSCRHFVNKDEIFTVRDDDPDMQKQLAERGFTGNIFE